MKKTILAIRIFFFLLCLCGAYLLWYVGESGENGEGGTRQSLAYYMLMGSLLGCFTILVDVFLKGFSLRGLTAISFGLASGSLIAYLISVSPLFEGGDEQTKFLIRLSLFIACTYIATVVTLRGKDEFNLVIPYMRFVPQKVELPIVVIDTSALIDGRVAGICRSGFLQAELVITRFVIEELQRVADASDPNKRDKGRKGLQVLNELRRMPNIHLTINDSEVERRNQVEAKLIFVASSLRARLLTVDYNLAKMAEFQGVEWLNINALARELRTEMAVGERFDVELVKQGKEPGQAVGYLSDGSMVVVNDADQQIGTQVYVEVVSVLPSAGGKIVFANLAS